MSIFDDQARMMTAFGNTTTTLNHGQAALYLRMMVEETFETLIAANPGRADYYKTLSDAVQQDVEVSPDANLVEVFDGVIDVMVVTAGAGISMGFPMQEGWDAVFATNIAKVDPETGLVRRRADGKVLKPEGWKPPTDALIDLIQKRQCGII